MKKSIAILILLVIFSTAAWGQTPRQQRLTQRQQRQEQRQTQRQQPSQTSVQERRARGYTRAWVEVEQGDSVQNIAVLPVYVFRRPADMRKYQRMVIYAKLQVLRYVMLLQLLENIKLTHYNDVRRNL